MFVLLIMNEIRTVKMNVRRVISIQIPTIIPKDHQSFN